MSVKKWLQHELTTKREILIFIFGCVVVFGLMAHAFGFLNLNMKVFKSRVSPEIYFFIAIWISFLASPNDFFFYGV